MIADKRPDVADFWKMSLNLKRPTFERGLAFPKKSVVTVNKFARAIVLGRVVAEHSQIKEIGRAWQKFERREIAFVKRAGVGPNPTNATLLEQPYDVRTVPACVPEFDCEPKSFWKLDEKLAQSLAAFLWRE